MCCVVSVLLSVYECGSMCTYVRMHLYKRAHTPEHKGQHFHFPPRLSVMLLQNGGQRIRSFHKYSILYSDIYCTLLLVTEKKI